MENNSIIEETVNSIRNEIKASLSRIHDLQKAELVFVTGIFAISSTALLKISPIIVLTAPLVAFAFQIFIINERNRLNRAGDFLRKHLFNDHPMKLWETHVKNKPVMYEAIGHLFINLLLIIFSLLLFISLKNDSTILLPITKQKGFSWEIIYEKYFFYLTTVSFVIFLFHFCTRCPKKNCKFNLFCMLNFLIKYVFGFFAPCTLKDDEN